MARTKVKPENRKRFTPAERSAQILAEAVRQASEFGLEHVTLIGVGRGVGVSDGLVAKYFSRIYGLQDAVLAVAVVNNDAEIVADAIYLGMPTTHVPPPLLQAAQQLLQAP